jgi:hypothetical protein
MISVLKNRKLFDAKVAKSKGRATVIFPGSTTALRLRVINGDDPQGEALSRLPLKALE